jgi:hypothetical protein
MHLIRTLSALVLATGPAVLAAPPVYAGPTASVDLLFGTSTQSLAGPADAMLPSSLYTAGFGLRAGWRFDFGPVWLLPEIGGGYVVERFQSSLEGAHVGRFVAGARIGWSRVVRPELCFEPAVFAHGGGGWYDSELHGPAYDVGLSLDLRIKRRFIAGVHVGYDALAHSIASQEGPFGPPFVTVTDGWVSYGVHGGYLFW